MSILSKSSFLSKWAALFATNGVRAITAAIQRDFRQDINDSFLNITDQAYDGVKGWKNGINTISGLKSITTAALSTGINIAFRDTANSDALRVYELTAGTDSESSPTIVRPNDYDGTTNQKVWKIAVAGGDFLYTGQSPATKTLNGITAGDDLSVLTVSQIIAKILAPYVNPVWNSFSVSGQSTTVEVGTTLSGSKTFTWSITANSGVVSTIDIKDVTGGTTLVAGTANDGSQAATVATLQLNSNGATQVWKGTLHDTGTTVQDIDSSPFTVTARYKVFFDEVSAFPTTSAQVRALTQSQFISGPTTIDLAIGTTGLKRSIWLPAGHSITKVEDVENLYNNITSDYVGTSFSVNDAGGTPRAGTLYNCGYASPYEDPTIHRFTIN